MRLDECFFTRLMPEPPRDIGNILEEQRNMHLYDRLRTGACGMILGQPEMFATRAARDAAVGACGKPTTFIATSWAEAQASGFTAVGIAIGHRLGTPEFDRVAKPVIDAAVRYMACTSMSVSVVIARSRYEVEFGDDGQFHVDRDMSQLSIAGDEQEVAATASWLRKLFTDRLTSRPAVSPNI
jgi:hypothetical protein